MAQHPTDKDAQKPQNQQTNNPNQEKPEVPSPMSQTGPKVTTTGGGTDRNDGFHDSKEQSKSSQFAADGGHGSPGMQSQYSGQVDENPTPKTGEPSRDTDKQRDDQNKSQQGSQTDQDKNRSKGL